MADVSMNVIVDAKVKEKLERISEEENRTLSGQVRVILDEWLDKVKS